MILFNFDWSRLPEHFWNNLAISTFNFIIGEILRVLFKAHQVYLEVDMLEITYVWSSYSFTHEIIRTRNHTSLKLRCFAHQITLVLELRLIKLSPLMAKNTIWLLYSLKISLLVAFNENNAWIKLVVAYNFYMLIWVLLYGRNDIMGSSSR